ncbi:MAG: hypothetical protein SGPRY_005918 [Prymnesium sp.]
MFLSTRGLLRLSLQSSSSLPLFYARASLAHASSDFRRSGVMHLRCVIKDVQLSATRMNNSLPKLPLLPASTFSVQVASCAPQRQLSSALASKAAARTTSSCSVAVDIEEDDNESEEENDEPGFLKMPARREQAGRGIKKREVPLNRWVPVEEVNVVSQHSIVATEAMDAIRVPGCWHGFHVLHLDVRQCQLAAWNTCGVGSIEVRARAEIAISGSKSDPQTENHLRNLIDDFFVHEDVHKVPPVEGCTPSNI